MKNVSGEIADFAAADRVRQALRQAIDVLWEWLPPTGGPSDDDTVARLGTIFADFALIESIDGAPKRLRQVVEDIRAILARRGTNPRKIINAIWNETAVDRPWLIKALGMPENKMTITVRPRTKARETPA
jgi:hypothetical protein